jgi:hypothetical protein
MKTDYITVASAPVNLALNKPATASSTTLPYTPDNAVDGSTSTFWVSGKVNKSNPTEWLSVDLGLPAPTFDRVVMNWKDIYYAQHYQFQASDDGSVWMTVFSTTSGSGGIEDVSFARTTARYFRVYMTKNNKSYYLINELEVYSASSSMAMAAAPMNVAQIQIVPDGFELHQNYPNPFNPLTSISFSLPNEAGIILKVYNLRGEEVASLVDGHLNAGLHSIVFQANDLPSGIYFYVLQAGEVRLARRLLLMK